MTRFRLAAVSLSLLSSLVMAAPAAHAFCGVIQETAQSKNPSKASKQASKLFHTFPNTQSRLFPRPNEKRFLRCSR